MRRQRRIDGRLQLTGLALASVVIPALLPRSAHAMYDPKHGRWLQRDPAGYADGRHLYEYARNCPTRYVDWIGRQASLPSRPTSGPDSQPTPPPDPVPDWEKIKRGDSPWNYVEWTEKVNSEWSQRRSDTAPYWPV
jgi:hypothetical protein